MALILDGTNGETFPTWITSGRPASPSQGQMGYNTTLNFMEVYNGSAWVQTQLPAAGTSGNVLSDNGTTWVSSAPSGGMTLLGTITPTAVNSISLSSLTLTGYKQIQIVFKNISVGGAGPGYVSYVSGDNTQSTGIWLVSGSIAVNAGNGIATLDLNAGSLVCNVSNTGAVYSNSNRGGIDSHNITTSTTTIYLRNGSTNTWTAQGTIYIYGVK